MPFHGQYELCTKLVESILRFTRSNYYCLCLVDDASPNSTYLEDVEKNLNRRQTAAVEVKCLRCEEQLGFGGAAGVGFAATENPYVVVVNSDCEFEDINWLRAMGESLLSMKEQDVRMVSAKTNNAVGGSPKQEGEKDSRTDIDLILDDDEHLSMYCFMAHRELFSRIGGFLKPYPYGWYEDEEIAYRMKKHKFKQGVSSSSWVKHVGEATIKSLWRKNPTIRTAMDENHDRCAKDMQSLGQKTPQQV